MLSPHTRVRPYQGRLAQSFNSDCKAGHHRQLAYPGNAETRQMIEQAILAEYEKVVAGSDPVPTETK
jgi:DNA-binding cell septation regulator SpoVG